MNAPAITTTLPEIGAPFEGGFFAGLIRSEGHTYGLIVAPKQEGEAEDLVWHNDYEDHPGATSYNDGAANTAYLASIGSPLAQWAVALRIDGRNDWYVPAQDELEVIYRNLKPTTDKNTRWARSGINLSAIEPTRPYTPDTPAQTIQTAFAAGGAEAFESAWYWSSTQFSPSLAWGQDFDGGLQYGGYKDTEGRARAVRRFLVI